MLIVPLKMTLEEKANLLEKVADRSHPEPNSGCWIWLRALDPQGYARMGFAGRNCRVSRLVIESAHGGINGRYALHRCDNPACVNPDHLYAGTASQNIIDSVRRNRHGMQKLTIDQVLDIRSSRETSITLARVYGMHKVSIREVRRRVKFAHVL